MDPIAVLFDSLPERMVFLLMSFKPVLLLLRDYAGRIVSHLRGSLIVCLLTVHFVHAELFHRLGTERRQDTGLASDKAF